MEFRRDYMHGLPLLLHMQVMKGYKVVLRVHIRQAYGCKLLVSQYRTFSQTTSDCNDMQQLVATLPTFPYYFLDHILIVQANLTGY